MFQLFATPFGKFKRYEFVHTNGKFAFSLVPEYGATPLQVMLNGLNLLDSHATTAQLELHDWGRNIFLFPFPNRLCGGRFTWQGKTYQFPINEPSLGNALHGFGMGAPTQLEEVRMGEDSAFAKFFHSYVGELSYFPFPFRVDYAFSISATDGFEIKLTTTNTGSSDMPFGLGWHPYIVLPGRLADWSLTLPPCRRVEIDTRMIPTGVKQEFSYFAKAGNLANVQLDHCFEIRETTGVAEFVLHSGGHSLRVWQETGLGKFNFVQLFIPPRRHCLALEPVSCNIDAFNNGDGLQILAPGESMGGSFGFRLE
jgi:aldose 1-epimerase